MKDYLKEVLRATVVDIILLLIFMGVVGVFFRVNPYSHFFKDNYIFLICCVIWNLLNTERKK